MSTHDPFLFAATRPQTRDTRLILAIAIAGAASIALVCWLVAGVVGLSLFLAFAIGLGVASGASMLIRPHAHAASVEMVDWGMLRATVEDGVSAVAITSRAGHLVCANPKYEALFAGLPLPRAIAFADDGAQRLTIAARTAWRDGHAELQDLLEGQHRFSAQLRRAGAGEDYLVWRFQPSREPDPLEVASGLVHGRTGERLGRAGMMMVLADPEGRLFAGNSVFVARAVGEGEDVAGRQLAELLGVDGEGMLRLTREIDGDGPSRPLRAIPVPLNGEDEDPDAAVTCFLLLDESPDVLSAAARGAATGHLHELLAMLPIGLALAERDGRVLFMNKSFRRAAGLGAEDAVVYPSDLVCDEDKATVADAVRRFSQGRALPGDLAIRLKHKPDEPVALTIANAKGLGDAAVLLSLKDNSEESVLKRQVAQATKMQAVGQLAGGVAHDFNNILTAIIGHCDLMAMRHTPGDIDYDDIQQIKHNSNRAASLTRQLLAFSRQQTMRPQVLQLPEVVSEVTQLMRRLLGETIQLEVKHGRNLGHVRADPGQLEQVIVNLAVNARDAMPDGGTMTIQTYAVSVEDVRRMRSDILPIGDYTALKVADTGCGISDDNLGKIFEPFFTTKEVGKGTGLGLSTVYGIVKQSGGFIFADSEIAVGTSFVIYLPVHHATEPGPQLPTPVEPTAGSELWGTGTILLVEDEAMVRAVGERALTRHGYHVLTASNGEEALEILGQEARIDLLVSDVVMPGMDGPALVRRARELYPDLRILFMSGYAEEQLRNSIDIERVAFLSKPFSVQQLGQAARDVLAQPAT